MRPVTTLPIVQLVAERLTEDVQVSKALWAKAHEQVQPQPGVPTFERRVHASELEMRAQRRLGVDALSQMTDVFRPALSEALNGQCDVPVVLVRDLSELQVVAKAKGLPFNPLRSRWVFDPIQGVPILPGDLTTLDAMDVIPVSLAAAQLYRSGVPLGEVEGQAASVASAVLGAIANQMTGPAADSTREMAGILTRYP